jgi:hypothetical protein
MADRMRCADCIGRVRLTLHQHQVIIDGVVDYASGDERLGLPSLVGQRLPPPKGRLGGGCPFVARA